MDWTLFQWDDSDRQRLFAYYRSYLLGIDDYISSEIVFVVVELLFYLCCSSYHVHLE